jgi:hypothetical protein
MISFLKSLRRSSQSVYDPNEFLYLFKKHKPAIYRNLDLFKMNFAQLSFPLLYARCRDGYYAEERPEFLLVTNNERHYVLPLTDDWQAFLRAVSELVATGGKVVAFPQIPDMPNRPNRYPEYLCETEFLATLPGRKVKAYRHDVRKLEAMGFRIEEGTEGTEELFEMNDQWYSDFEYRKGFKAERRAEAEAIISLSDLCMDDHDLVRVFRALITGRETAVGPSRRATKFCGFLVTCRLSESYWASVLSRSLFEYSGLGHYLWQKAAQAYLREGVPMENDSTGGFDPALCAYKERFSSALLNTYQLRSKGLSRFLW